MRNQSLVAGSAAGSIEGEESLAPLGCLSPFPLDRFRSRHEDSLRFEFALADKIIVDDLGPIIP
jgi:hypothetical protein